MSWDFKSELKRKGVHLLALSFIAVFVLVSVNYGKQLALLALVLLLIVFLELEYVRLEMRQRIPVLWRLWRDKENNKFGGQVFFLIGSIISLAVFDFDIALTAILMTIFGDMAAALVGQKFGRIWLAENRSLEGILAELGVDVVIAFLVVGYYGGDWVLMCVMPITATTVETVIEKMDDNLIIPLFSGFNGQIARFILTVFK